MVKSDDESQTLSLVILTASEALGKSISYKSAPRWPHLDSSSDCLFSRFKLTTTQICFFYTLARSLPIPWAIIFAM